MIRRRWRAWKRAQQSRVVFVAIPAGSTITASGLHRTLRIMELWR